MMGSEAAAKILALEDKVAWLDGFVLALQQRVEQLERPIVINGKAWNGEDWVDFDA